MDTGENSQGLRKILDLTRIISITVLLLHFYYFCYDAFYRWKLTTTITDRLLLNIEKTGLFDSFNRAKIISLAFLLISLLGARGKKDEKIKWKACMIYFSAGLAIYFYSAFLLNFSFDLESKSRWYMILTSAGFLLMLTGGTYLSRVIRNRLTDDIFNKYNETFPQEERFLSNEYSINLPTRYQFRGKTRKGWINIINPFRATLICGGPGSGKTLFVVRHIIEQHISKGFTAFIYDFKYDDLTRLAYHFLEKYKSSYKILPEFCVINFDNLSQSHRCNPLDPDLMFDITDASESARTIMLGLNREWIRKQGDFWVESPIIFLTAIIWYLKKFNGGEYCTLPHVIELMQVEYDKLFSILRLEPEIEAFINPFITAYLNDAMEQLEGQIAGAKIAMARLTSPQLYWVMTGNDFTLDINNPSEPKIFCAGNNPQKIQTYGAVLSLYINRLIKLVNKKGGQKCSLVFDEFPTIYLNNIDSLIATARSNKVATTLAVQDLSQLKKDYGKEQAEVIMNIVGNVISGQVMGETAEQLSKRFGRINQDRESLSINSSDTSISKSKQLEFAIPTSTISTLSSGQFVGMVADDPDQRIELKIFHAEITNSQTGMIDNDSSSKFPKIRTITDEMVQKKYRSIKNEIELVVESQVQYMMDNPKLSRLIVKKK
ncbi:MAG TPA: conjugal transfer protein MobC [Puia sp.]|nr:conjugal transfer protein MobC [Puia sp.]